MPETRATDSRTAAFLAALRAALPDLDLAVDRADTAAFRYDETEYTYPGWPLAVPLPRTTAEVATIVTLAARHAVPIVPRGAGSGLSGGATAVDGALTLVTTKMDRIIEIDTGNLAAVVQPGVINADLGRAAAKHGLFYAPDPASFEICTIGGNLAENSGGLRCVKYGVTRDAVLGLEVVLANPAASSDRSRTVKDVAGYTT
jgi:glycolate oxidase